MPIVTFGETTLEQRCASCGLTSDVPLAGVRLGLGLDAQRQNLDAIRLPACPRCGACEFLLRTWDRAPPELDPGAADHRRVVNRLAVVLKGRDQLDPLCAKRIHAEREDPPDLHPVTPGVEQPKIAVLRAGAPPPQPAD